MVPNTQPDTCKAMSEEFDSVACNPATAMEDSYLVGSDNEEDGDSSGSNRGTNTRAPKNDLDCGGAI